MKWISRKATSIAIACLLAAGEAGCDLQSVVRATVGPEFAPAAKPVTQMFKHRMFVESVGVLDGDFAVSAEPLADLIEGQGSPTEGSPRDGG